MISAKTVDEYIEKSPEWAQEKLSVLRQIVHDAGLKEAIKWGGPCYVGKANVIGLGAFKNFVSVWFYQGVFLADNAKVLESGSDKTRGMRQWRFGPNDRIDTELFRQYVQEAILNDEKGLKIAVKKKPLVVPKLLEDALGANQKLRVLFEAMSLSHQREYCDHINAAKREETKMRRLDKCIEMILNNKGLHDKYRK